MSRHAAETTFAGLLTYLESFPPSPHHSTLHVRKRNLETIPYPRVTFKKNPHKKPHPKYKDGVTILGKTKFGIPVTEEQFKNNHFAHPPGLDPEDLLPTVPMPWWETYHRTENQRMWAQEARAQTLKGALLMNEAERKELEDWRTRLRITKGEINEGVANVDEMEDYAQFLEVNTGSKMSVASPATMSSRIVVDKVKELMEGNKNRNEKRLRRRVVVMKLTKSLLARSPFRKKAKVVVVGEDLDVKYNPYMDKGWDGGALDEYPGEMLAEGCDRSILNDYDPMFVDVGWGLDEVRDDGNGDWDRWA